jgi:excisionase family DNA binding protein
MRNPEDGIMTQTKTRPVAPTRKATRPKRVAMTGPEVLTLPEAAAYLRISVDELLRVVKEQGLPARKIGEDWRFLKTALQYWLSTSTSETTKKPFWQTHFGALKDDPYLEEMLAEIYRRRGRPEVEES